MLPIQKIDVLIVGSGPAGTSTALHLLQQDPAWANRIIIVDKAIHPREKLCGGGVTHLGENILSRLGLPFDTPNFPVREVRLVYQDQTYTFHGNPVFRIVHRAEFDHWLVRHVQARGVEVRQGEAVEDVIPHDDYVEVISEACIYHARVLIAADGSRSRIRAKLKWDDDSRVARLIEVLTPEQPNKWEFRDGVAVFDFTHMTDGLQGYYWDFPSFVGGTLQMNRGVFDSRARPERPKADLKETLRESMAERERNLDDYKIKGHPIRWFDKNGRFSQPHILLAGDAAGADPLFGEGISIALAYGDAAAQTVVDAFATQDFRFADYRRRILRHNSVLSHLAMRVWLARLAYWMKYPWFVRFGWRMARLIIRFTAWRNPDYVPAEPVKQV